MGTSMNAKALFGEYMKFMHGTKDKRMHVYVDKATSEKVREESQKLGVSISEYVIYTALTFKVRDIPDKLDRAISKLDTLMRDGSIRLVHKQRTDSTRKGETDMAEQEKNITENMENSEGRTEQLHLRVTGETYDVIKRKAAEFSMSISDYIVFVITHFNLMEFSEKVDEINRKLDAMTVASAPEEGN